MTLLSIERTGGQYIFSHCSSCGFLETQDVIMQTILLAFDWIAQGLLFSMNPVSKMLPLVLTLAEKQCPPSWICCTVDEK